MVHVTVILTEAQAGYVETLLSIESAKIAREMQCISLVEFAAGTPDDGVKALMKPAYDRAQAIFAIAQAFSAAWPKPAAPTQ